DRKSRHRRIKKQRRYERLAATSRLSPCRIPLVRTGSEAAVRRPGKVPEGTLPIRPPAGTRRPALAAGAARAVHRQPTGSRTGTPVPSPRSQSFSRGYGSILPTSLAYIVPSTAGRSPWRPDAVMSTTGREWHSVLRIFKGRRGRTGHHATCGALPPPDPTSGPSRFRGSTKPCASAVHMEPFPLFGLQSSHLNICYYHQDPHRRPLRPDSRPEVLQRPPRPPTHRGLALAPTAGYRSRA
ncbi:unnamed protein product, partial [Prunus brigantina]